MAAKLLGQFLIDAGAIDATQLAEVLLEQMSASPPHIKILFDQGKLDAHQVVTILDYQSAHKVAFEPACVSLGLWQPEFSGIIREQTRICRPLVGELLVRKKLVTADTLLRMLRNYQSSLPANTGPAEGATEPKAVVTPPPTTCEDEDASSFSPTFDLASSTSIDGFHELFSPEKRGHLEASFLSLDTLDISGDAGDQIRAHIDTCFGAYHSIKGSARTAGGVLLERLLHQTEELLGFFKQFAEQVNVQHIHELVTLNLRVLDKCWELREELVQQATERAIWENEADRAAYLGLCGDVREQHRALEALNLRVDADALEDLF